MTGDRLDPATIAVRVDEAATTGSWTSVPVRAGSTYLVSGVEAGSKMRVIYTDSNGASVVLVAHEVGA